MREGVALRTIFPFPLLISHWRGIEVDISRGRGHSLKLIGRSRPLVGLGLLLCLDLLQALQELTALLSHDTLKTISDSTELKTSH